MEESLGGPFSISSDIQGTECISICPDQTSHENIIITSKKSITVYHCATRIATTTFMLPSWFQPSSGAVNDQDGIFYCQIDKSKYIKWSNSDTELSSLKRSKAGGPIHSLVAKKGKVYIVFENGFIQNICSPMVEPPKILPEGEKIHQVLISNNTVAVLTHSKKNYSTAQQQKVYHYDLNCAVSGEISSFVASRPGLKLVGVGLAENLENWYTKIVLYCLWENGELSTSGITSRENWPHYELYLKVEGNIQRTICCNAPVEVLQVTPKSVAFLGQHVSSDGGSVVLYDMRVQKVTASKRFKLYEPSMQCWGASGEGATTSQEVPPTGGVFLRERQQITCVPLTLQNMFANRSTPTVDVKLLRKNLDEMTIEEILTDLRLSHYKLDVACKAVLSVVEGFSSFSKGGLLKTIDKIIKYFVRFNSANAVKVLEILLISAAEEDGAVVNKRTKFDSSIVPKGDLPKHVESLENLFAKQIVDPSNLVKSLQNRLLLYRPAIKVIRLLELRISKVTDRQMEESDWGGRYFSWLDALAEAFSSQMSHDGVDSSKLEAVENDIMDSSEMEKECELITELETIFLNEKSKSLFSDQEIERKKYSVNKILIDLTPTSVFERIEKQGRINSVNQPDVTGTSVFDRQAYMVAAVV